MPRQPGKPREPRESRRDSVLSQTLSQALGAPRRWMTADWRARRMVRLRRLGEWVAMTRARLGMSLLELERQARHDGEDISETLIRRLETLRTEGANLTDVRRVSLPAVDYLAALAGQTLADVDAYLRSGEEAALEPTTSARAETVRAAFLSLSPARQQALEDFAQHLYQLDLVEAGSAPPHHAPSGSSAHGGAVDAATRRTLDELHTVSADALRALTTDHPERAERSTRETGQSDQTETRRRTDRRAK